jgi:hypothetical protein
VVKIVTTEVTGNALHAFFLRSLTIGFVATGEKFLTYCTFQLTIGCYLHHCVVLLMMCFINKLQIVGIQVVIKHELLDLISLY